MEALYIGRFQPFHNGHGYCLRYILSREKKLCIVIGSSNKSRTSENPFTADERMRMVELFLDENGFGPRCAARCVPDFDTDDGRWFNEVKRNFPNVSTLYSNNERPKKIFERNGIEVLPIPFLERRKFSGTYIRSKLGKDISSLVPKSTLEVIKEAKIFC